MERIKKFLKYIYEVGKSWINIVFFVLDILSLIAIYINPSLTILPIIFTMFLLVSFMYSAYLHYEKAIGDSIDIVIKHKPVQRIYRVLEIYNSSEYDIGDIEIRVEWKQREGPMSRNLGDSVIDANVNLVKASASTLSVLKSKEKVWATNVPHHSLDGKMDVYITGVRLDIDKPFNFEKQIDVPQVDD
jgi:hypothetical protein